MGVSGSSSAELLANFCDNILKKGSSGKLSDEDIEETLEKVSFTPDEIYYLASNRNILELHNFLINLQVVKLLDYISNMDLFTKFYR